MKIELTKLKEFESIGFLSRFLGDSDVVTIWRGCVFFLKLFSSTTLGGSNVRCFESFWKVGDEILVKKSGQPVDVGSFSHYLQGLYIYIYISSDLVHESYLRRISIISMPFNSLTKKPYGTSTMFQVQQPFLYSKVVLPQETNMSPEKERLEDASFPFEMAPFFHCLCRLRPFARQKKGITRW